MPDHDEGTQLEELLTMDKDGIYSLTLLPEHMERLRALKDPIQADPKTGKMWKHHPFPEELPLEFLAVMAFKRGLEMMEIEWAPPADDPY